ncbi:FkbM family methyltransferase [Mesorhizobium sp. M0965]|uniref:FkbM family methyltransferase n=1 Tax=unclassified Mesorhizobium TaxID=325217 RepID=UPI0033376F1B
MKFSRAGSLRVPSIALLKKAVHKFRRALHQPRVSISRVQTLRLGSAYGGWDFIDREELHGSTVISCGLGEDASFDVEFAAKYGAKVIILDPTPRAIAHYQAIVDRMARGELVPTTGEPWHPGRYDLTNIKPSQLLLIPKALWVEETSLKFFAPSDPKHVSHSIIDFQNNYQMTGTHIQVSTVTVEMICRDYSLTTLPLLKLDIEGAEVDVLKHMVLGKVRPSQILVEFDELTHPSKRSNTRFFQAHEALLNAGYQLRYRRGANYLYEQPGSSNSVMKTA